ncbi:MAG: hypothetical protein HOO06_14620 [Bdellovibrionaceae bacterium]|mgnify:CR=1 FL=1|jgi:hypothetical protein|nr:hypothetical protein [Pseudobdellovibrionaceae bacterium]
MNLIGVFHWNTSSGSVEYFAIEKGTHNIIVPFRQVKLFSQSQVTQLVDDFHDAVINLCNQNKIKVIYKIKHSSPVSQVPGTFRGNKNQYSGPLLTYFRTKFKRIHIIQRKSKVSANCLTLCKAGLTHLNIWQPNNGAWQFHLWTFAFKYSTTDANANLKKNWKLFHNFQALSPQREVLFQAWVQGL